MRKARRLPHNLKKVVDITERYFRKHGEVTATTVVFSDEGMCVQEHASLSDPDKCAIADDMVAAAAAGATAVAFVAECWFEEECPGAPQAKPKQGECLVITYEEPHSACKCMCKINRQRYGAPRLSKWEFDAVRPSRSTAPRLECIFERACIRHNTELTGSIVEPQLTLLLSPNGQCLRNDAGEALVVSNMVMARESIERWSEGGSFRCALASDHVDQLVVNGSFCLTSAEVSVAASPEKVDHLREFLELTQHTLESFQH